MEIIEVGRPYAPIVGHPEGVFFDASDAGFTLIYNFARPTSKEVNAVRQDQPFEIRHGIIGGVLWILTKAGSLEWTDAPYAPQLTKHATLVEPEYPDGLALTLLMTDATTGIVRHARLIGLGAKYSQTLLDDINTVGSAPWDHDVYMASVNATMRKYSTRDLVRMATSRWALK